MCFTPLGRLHTRCASLLGPAVLAGAFAAATDKPDYWMLLVLMLVCGIGLDLAVYCWLIGYQSRWLTLALDAIEFLVIKWVMEWPYPLEIRLHTWQGLIFYVLSWCLVWPTLYMVLPRIAPRWIEDGGEFRARGQLIANLPRLAGLERRRQIFLVSTAVVLVGGLLWLVAEQLTPSGYVFTGLMTNEIHFGALAVATRAAGGAAVADLAGLIGWIARITHWPAITIYQAMWVVGCWAWLLGAQLCCSRYAWPYLPLLVLPPLLFSVPQLLLAAAVVWALAAGPRWRVGLPWPTRAALFALPGVAAIVLIVAAALAQPILYLDQGTWQALTWMNQSVAPETIVALPDNRVHLFTSLGGVQASQGRSAALLLTEGAGCSQARVVFRHGSVCVVALR